MLWGSLPFQTEARRVHQHWLAGRNPHIVFGSMSEAMQKLILESLTVSMNDRPSAMELLVHPAFAVKELQASSAESDSSPAVVSDNASALAEILLSSCGLLSLCSKVARGATKNNSSSDATVDVDLSSTSGGCDQSRCGGGGEAEELGEGSEWKERQYRKQALRHIMGNRWGRTVNTSRKQKRSPLVASTYSSC